MTNLLHATAVQITSPTGRTGHGFSKGKRGEAENQWKPDLIFFWFSWTSWWNPIGKPRWTKYIYIYKLFSLWSKQRFRRRVARWECLRHAIHQIHQHNASSLSFEESNACSFSYQKYLNRAQVVLHSLKKMGLCCRYKVFESYFWFMISRAPLFDFIPLLWIVTLCLDPNISTLRQDLHVLERTYASSRTKTYFSEHQHPTNIYS